MENKLLELKRELKRPEIRKTLAFHQNDREKVIQSIRQNQSVVRRPVKNFVYSKRAIPTIAASLFVICSIFFYPQLQVALAKVPGVHYLFTLFADEGVQKAKQQDLFHSLNEKNTSNGISVSVNELLYDGSRFIIRYTAESNTKNVSGDNAAPGNMLLTINGEDLNYRLSSSGHQENTENKEELLLEIIPGKSLPDQFDLGISFSNIGETAGDWKFQIPVVKNEKLTHTVKTNISSTYDETGTTMTVNEVNFSPTAIAIKTNVKNPLYSTEMVQNLIPKGDIQDGFPVIEFEVMDDQGYVLPYIAADNWISSPIIKVMPYEDLSYLPKTLTVKTIIHRAWGASTEGKPHPFEEKQLLLTPTPYLVKQEENAGLFVTKVEDLKDEIQVHYEIKGNLHLMRNSIYLLSEKNNQKIRPSNYLEMDYYNRNHVAKFDKAMLNNEPIDQLFIGTMKTDYREIKELEVTVPIK
ncbi:DUF4179 domain-containing protein [Neobacillus sp. D3-1R]|uniref:DUF4179 domain-containing protein n=1 Tax=Neobacillus sp. D3-1R TaxID=3445778 RepID=UPI003FA02E4A